MSARDNSRDSCKLLFRFAFDLFQAGIATVATIREKNSRLESDQKKKVVPFCSLRSSSRGISGVLKYTFVDTGGPEFNCDRMAHGCCFRASSQQCRKQPTACRLRQRQQVSSARRQHVVELAYSHDQRSLRANSPPTRLGSIPRTLRPASGRGRNGR